jgi:hypothetical protein
VRRSRRAQPAPARPTLARLALAQPAHVRPARDSIQRPRLRVIPQVSAPGWSLAGTAALGAAMLALAGCSQVAAIAPVGGERMATVRYAAIDVLVAAGVAVETAPVCTEDQADQSVTCTGSAVDGATIAVTSTGADPSELTVAVGGTTLYSGDIQSVLEKAMDGS